MLGDCTAAVSRRTSEDLMKESTPRSPTADDSMTEKEKDDMADQMEEFEGPDRREDRGDNEKPTPEDPGVGSS
jgi:polyhydroxyalkanoate synthesis regulator phasin